MKDIIKIKLKDQPCLRGYEGAFYHLHTQSGAVSVKGIFDNWYEALAIDEAGNEYTVIWSIENFEAFENGNEDCCDWDNADEIYSWAENRPVKAVIEW